MRGPRLIPRREKRGEMPSPPLALQMLACAPELAVLVETWFCISEQARTEILRQAASIRIGAREYYFPIAGSTCKIAAGLLILRLVQT